MASINNNQSFSRLEKFVVVRDTTKKVRRFGLQGRTLEFKIKATPKDHEPLRWIKDAVNQILDKGVEGLKPTDKVGFTFCSKDFARGDGWIPFQNADEVTFHDLWKLISSVYQSNSSGISTETFCLGVTSVKLPVGKGRTQNYNTFTEECLSRRGIIVINNKDSLCLPRAIVVSKAHVDKDPDYNRIRKDTGKMQTARAMELVQVTGLVVPEEGCGIPELQRLQEHLTDYSITAYNYGSRGRDIVFKGTGGAKKLNLLHHEGHFNVITSLTAAFACVYYCEECYIPFDHKEHHRCGGTCPCCTRSPKCRNDGATVKCNDCNRAFNGQQCYNNHKGKTCKSIKRCNNCLKTVRTNRKHYCGEIYCKTCASHAPGDHMCYMQIDKRTPSIKNTLFVFYDLETRQEKIQHDESLLHETSLCVFSQRCDSCIKETRLAFCQTCGMRLQILNEKPIETFLNYVLKQRKAFKRVIVIGHNAGGFDHQFLLNHIMTKTDIAPELITRGTKLVLMTMGNVKFVDSLNYFPMALGKLPAVFGFTQLKKGYFPHLFNTEENQNYVGPLPAVEYYDIDNMKCEEQSLFLKWHQENKDRVFDFKNEIMEYCISDVEILTQACLKFRDMLITEGNVDPFVEAATLPSACNLVFRRNFLQPNTIGLIPKHGYRRADNQSRIALKWLLWEEKVRDINIVQAAKGKEARIAGVKVDGYCDETRQIFEFHGCYFHGCPRCFHHGRDKPCYDNSTISMETRYEDTMVKTERLREFGYEVVEKWECDFRREITDEILSYTGNHPLLARLPLNPRDAFYGGRTGAARTYYKIKPGEKIKYVDVCSLYPWVNKYGKYPVGHPVVIVGEQCAGVNVNDIEGLIRCKILPPQDLYHPVLPVKLNSKLMFCLCYTCADNYIQDECNHDVEERALVGTWTTDEVKKAIEKSYQLLEVYEIWSYKITKYNTTTKTGGLFNEYISKFLKVKQQASGWPPNCNNDDEKQKYVAQYLKREGVQLDPTQICKNPGRRQLGKTMITSFWGKLGQRENQQKTSIVNETSVFFNMLTNPAININTVQPVNGNVLIVSWAHKEEVYEPLSTVNVVLAAYTTAQARLKLYSYLEKLDDRVLYYDTDSVIYISRPGEYDVPLGEYLGDMTDELDGEYIEEFASGGPKLYGFRQYPSGKETFKVKGISINTKTSQQVNLNTLKEMVLEERPPVYITSKNIRRTAEHEVVTKTQTKLFRPNFKKRRLIDDYNSLPFGYKRKKVLIV